MNGQHWLRTLFGRAQGFTNQPVNKTSPLRIHRRQPRVELRVESLEARVVPSVNTYKWTGASGTDTNWNNPLNWARVGTATGAFPGDGTDGTSDVAQFVGNAFSSAVNPTVNGTFSIGEIDFGTALYVTIAGDGVAGDGLTLSGPAQIVSANTFGTRNSGVDTIAASLTVPTRLTIANSAIPFGIIVDGIAVGLILSGNVTSTGGLTVNGTGATTLSGNNSYGGPIALTGGALLLGTSTSPITSMPAGNIVDNGYLAMVLPDGANLAYNGAISGSGSVTIQGTGATLSLGGMNTYSGPTVVGANTIQLTTANALPAASAFSVGTTNAPGVVDLNGNNGAIASITAVNPLLANQLTNSSATPATLSLMGSGTIFNVNLPITGPISLTVGGTGTTILSAVNTYTGSTTINGTDVVAGNSAALPNGGPLTVGGTGVLDLNGTSLTVSSLSGVGTTNTITNTNTTMLSTLTISNSASTSQSFSYTGSITGTVSIINATGPQTLTVLGLGSNNTFTGGVTATSGTLAGPPGSFGTGTATLNGGTLDLAGSQAATAFTNNIQATPGTTSNLTLQANDMANAYSTSGSLVVPTGSPPTTVNIAADPNSTLDQQYSLTIGGKVKLGGNVNVANNGTGAGTLILAGQVGGPGQGTSIGSIGGGNVTLTSTSTYNEVLGGSSAFDTLNVAGALNLGGGILKISYATALSPFLFSPFLGETFTILSSTGSLTGTFGNTPLVSGVPTITAGNVTFSVTYNSNSVVLTATTVVPAATLFLSAPSTATAGTPITVNVAAENGSGFTAGGFTGTVTLSSSAGGISPTTVNVVNGLASVPINLTVAGPQTIMATFSGLTPATASVTVSPNVFNKFVVNNHTGSPPNEAGSPFAITVQASDLYGNPITSYTPGVGGEPATVNVAINPPNNMTATGTTNSTFPMSGVPIDNTGQGITFGELDVAGTYTVTAAGGSFTGSSAPLTVVAGLASKLLFTTQPVATPTGVKLPSVVVSVLDQFGNVVTSDTGTDNLTLSVASGPGDFLPGSTVTVPVVAGLASFSNLTLVVPGTYTLGAIVPGQYIGPNSSPFSVAPLQVVPGSFLSSPSGFSLQFNAPFLVNSTTPVLYGTGFHATAPVPSVKLKQTKDGSGNPIKPVLVEGSVVLNTATNSLTFVETNTASVINNGTPILPDGTYMVDILDSGATGIQAQNGGGGFLDGLASGTPGSGDYKTTFTLNTSASGADIVWVPATADGPQQSLEAPGANQGGAGYPVYLNDHTGAVTSVQVTFNYNPAMLSVTGANNNGNLPGSSFTLNTMLSTPGHAVLTYSDSGANSGNLMGGQVPLGSLQATVANSSAAAPIYRGKDFLHLSGVSVNGGAIPATTGDALHLVAFVGDANGDGVYTSDDAVKITRTDLQADSGFAAYPLVDAAIVADTDGLGFIPADAALQVNEAGVDLPTATLANPPIPAGANVTPIGNNVDPSLSLPSNLQVGADGRVTVPVNIDDAHPAGSTGLIEAHLALTYDPSIFTVSAADVHLGTVLAAGSGWSVQPTIDPVTGQIAIALSSSTPISSAVGGSLVTIDFHQADHGEPSGVSRRIPGSAAIALVASVSPNGQYVATELEDAQGTFTLTPAPTNGFDPRIDGVVFLTATPVAVSVTTEMVAAAATSTTAPPETQRADSHAADASPFDTTNPAQPTMAPEASPEEGEKGSKGEGEKVISLSPLLPFYPSPALLPGLVFQFSSVAAGAAPGGNGMCQPPTDSWLQTLARGTVSPLDPAQLVSTVRDALERVLASQVRLPQVTPDDDDRLNWDAVSGDLDGLAVGDPIALLEHRGPSDGTVHPTTPAAIVARTLRVRPHTASNGNVSPTTPAAMALDSVVNHAALDHYFAETADDAD